MFPDSDQVGFCRKLSGDIPPKLVGASITVVGSKVYVFGGCLANTANVISDMYVCDLENYKWEKVEFATDNIIPAARCFHSTDSWNGQLVVFGGYGSYHGPLSAEEPGLLNDIQIFDVVSGRWLSPHTLNAGFADLVETPRPRHSHLSIISSDRLFVIGGEEANNTWLDDIHVYDLTENAWIQAWRFPRPSGTYLNVVACAEQYVHFPSDGLPGNTGSPQWMPSPIISSGRGSPSSSLQAPPTISSATYLDSGAALADASIPSPPYHLPYSAEPSDDFPCDIYMYSNYNSTNVKRKLESFSPPISSDFTVRDYSPNLSEIPAPPLLRFPSGAIVGTRFIVAGTCLGQSSQFFSIWVLDLVTLSWSHIDTGSDVAYGSWFQGRLWRDVNKWIMFGDRSGSIAHDYSQRLSSWDYIAIVDLESSGIYQPPPLEFDLTTQELCLTALEESVETDFEFICDDGRKIRCSRKLIEGRWPWFHERMVKLLERVKNAMDALPASAVPNRKPLDSSTAEDRHLGCRMTSRYLEMGRPYAPTLALLQYFYTLALLTPLQQNSVVLGELLTLSTTYHIPHLTILVRHAMHQSLSESTCESIYEVATRCGCHSLRLRAFKFVLSYRQKGATPQVALPQFAPPAPLQLAPHGRKLEHPAHVPGMKPPIDIRVVPSRNESTPEDLFPADRHISVILDVDEYSILETPRDSPSRLDTTTPMPPIAAKPPTIAKSAASPSPVPATTRKSKPKEFLNRLLRTASGSKGENNKWRPAGGGGGRHPIASRVSKEQKLRMIQEALGDYSEAPGKQGQAKSVSAGGQRRPPALPTSAAATHQPESLKVVELSPYREGPRGLDLNSPRGVEVPSPSSMQPPSYFLDQIPFRSTAATQRRLPTPQPHESLSTSKHQV